MAAFEKIVAPEGHLIDSGLMRQIFDGIISDGVVSPDFYSSRDHETLVRLNGCCSTVENLITLFLFRWPDPCVITGRCLKQLPI